MKADKLEVKVSENRQIMGELAAKSVGAKIREIQETKDEINIIFASAPSQNEFLQVLSHEPDIDWHKINAFHMDEYVGLPSDATQNFGYFLKVRLFDKVKLKSVFYINGNAADIQAECERYAQLLVQYPADIICLGIGENTHIAFNDPFVADFNDPVLVKKVVLDQASRQQQVNDKCFESFDDVPKEAITLTVPALLKPEFAFCIVPGEKKADAIYHTIREDISTEFPSTILREHPNAILFVDQDSAGRLSKTSSYTQA